MGEQVASCGNRLAPAGALTPGMNARARRAFLVAEQLRS
jgi:hypothetical protein